MKMSVWDDSWYSETTHKFWSLTDLYHRMAEIKYKVKKEEEGLRLDQLLSKMNEVPSRSSAQRWVKDKHVQINKTIVG